MLLVLTILVVTILLSKIPEPKLPKHNIKYVEEAAMYYETTLDYRKNILAIILTAFGAWVGAGAAYFFGRENLRESANSLLSLHKQMTGQEKLNTLTVREIPPKPLDKILDDTSVFKEVLESFEKEPNRWFVPYQTSDKFYIINNDSLFIYLQYQMDKEVISSPEKSYTEIKESVLSKTIKDVTKEIEANENLKMLLNKFVPVIMDANVADVNSIMQDRQVFLAVVRDITGSFTHYFTTNDIRKALLKI